jgi:hypothetical protein
MDADSISGRRRASPSTGDIVVCLGQSFSDAAAVMRGMAACNCVLANSRALECFVPGSCKLTSGWDVYVPNERTCVGITLETMAKSGVQWADLVQPIRDLADSPVGSVVFWEEKYLERLLRYMRTPSDVVVGNPYFLLPVDEPSEKHDSQEQGSTSGVGRRTILARSSRCR